MRENQIRELERKCRIKNYYQYIGLEELRLRTVKSIIDADESEAAIREYAYKAIQELLNGLDVQKYFSQLFDATHTTGEEAVLHFLLKAEQRGNGGDLRLDLLMNWAIDTVEDEETMEWLSEIWNDYFMNYATNVQKSFIASDFLDIWAEFKEETP